MLPVPAVHEACPPSQWFRPARFLFASYTFSQKLFSACTFPDLKNIFDTFLPQLLLYPNPTDPLNGEAAALMMREPEKYAARIKGTPAHHSTLPLPGLRTQ